MSTSIYQNANLIGAYVARKVLRLQSAFLGSGSGSADARASLARLRRLDKPSGGAWASAGDELFSGLPDIGASRKDEDRMLKTIKASLKLYALHQQSKQKPMALNPKDADDDNYSVRRTFGWSCRQIEPDIDNAAGVVRRLVSVEAARDFANSPADSQEVQGYQFFKVFDEAQLEYILVAGGAGEDIYTIGKMAAFQIQTLLVA